MVGIVIVSHSAQLAAGVLELAAQMTQGQTPIATAGGIDDPENPIGTDPMRVVEAIQSVYGEDGVVVLMDLGSALLSADVALEILPDDQRNNVFLSAAPLVEGTMAAAVQASIGGTAAEVMAAAQGALAAKATQLDVDVSEAPAAAKSTPAADAQTITITIHNAHGLHARPAAALVGAAQRYDAQVTVSAGGRTADANSFNQVATLGLRQGDTADITAGGPDATAALDAIQQLAAENFGELDSPDQEETATLPTPEPIAEDGTLTGIAASPGIAIGPAYHYRPVMPEVESYTAEDTAAEWQQLQEAIAAAKDEIEALHQQAVTQIGADEAAIFEAHALVLQDPALLVAIRGRIESESLNAAAAWQTEISAVAAGFRAMDNALMQARAADIEDVGRRVLGHLLEAGLPVLALARPSILIADDLSPSDAAQLDPERVLAVCTAAGGATAHSAILARALGIPAVVGLGPAIWQAAEGGTIAVNGATGQVWLEPRPDQLADLQARRDEWLVQQREAQQAAGQAAVTVDGHVIEVAANIAGDDEVGAALSQGAEGVGLFRTEFLFIDRDRPPTEEEQYDVYRRAATLLGQRPLLIRTLDAGGDKPVDYFDMGQEANPFLGWRGVRFWFDRPDLHRPQLRAILRAGASHDDATTNVHIMFPMISTLEELRRAKALVAEVAAELEVEGVAYAADVPLGIMIEVPAAVAVADQLAPEVDFFSIGTNDLTQYTMAADRGNTGVAALVDALQPAVLRLIKQTADAAHAAGIWVGMCGEMAGNSAATPLLIGLGLDELSMSAPSIPTVKAAVRAISLDEAQQLAAEALRADSAAEVKVLLQSWKLQI